MSSDDKQKFSSICALLNVLCEKVVELTFENLLQRRLFGASSDDKEKFSNICALLNVLCENVVELTFENLLQRRLFGASSEGS